MKIAELSTASQAGKHGPLKGKCCVKPGSYIKGTYFLGGAGLNGLYIPKLIEAFHKAGIKSAIHLDREKWSAGQNIDATIGVFLVESTTLIFLCCYAPTLIHTNSST